MKNLILLCVAIFCLIGCSVEHDELDLEEQSLRGVNLMSEVPDCETQHNISNYGILQITNDNEFMYIAIQGIDGYLLADSKLHVANSLSEFPVREIII